LRCGAQLPDRRRGADSGAYRLSLVSSAQARLNLDTELNPFGWDFDAVGPQRPQTWNRVLGSVEVAGVPPINARCFPPASTAHIPQKRLTDVDGTYLDMNRRSAKSRPSARLFTAATHCGAASGRSSLCGRSSSDSRVRVRFFIEAADRGGWIPERVNGGYSPVMVAQHQQSLITSSYQKVSAIFDAERAFLRSSTT